MENDLFLCGESIQLSSEAIKISVYHRSTSALGSLEYSMLYKMSYAAVESFFIPRSASDAEGAVGHGRAAFSHGIL